MGKKEREQKKKRHIDGQRSSLGCSNHSGTAIMIIGCERSVIDLCALSLSLDFQSLLTCYMKDKSVVPISSEA